MALPAVTGTPTCSTPSPQHKGLCCLVAQQGLLGQVFQYTDCKGRTRCAKCTTRASTSSNPARAGQQVFVYRRAKCGPSGCVFTQQGVSTTVL